MNTSAPLSVIYVITNRVNGKCYVGQSKDIATRWAAHRNGLNAGRHHSSKLQRAWDKYGEENFMFEVISKADSFDELDELEKHYIAVYDSWTDGYNMTEGGELRGNNQIPCTWNKLPFPSKKAAARSIGISQNAMGNRLRQGIECDEDTRQTHRTCTWNGQVYGSLPETCKANNIANVSTLFRWLAKGYTKDEDVPKHKCPCTWNKIAYGSHVEGANANGFTLHVFRRYLREGWVRDADIKAPQRRLKPCTWNKVKYPSVKEVARACGVSECTMTKRFANGYTCDADLRRVAKSCVVNRVTYTSTRMAADALDFPYDKLAKLLREAEKVSGKRELSA